MVSGLLWEDDKYELRLSNSLRGTGKLDQVEQPEVSFQSHYPRDAIQTQHEEHL